MAKHAGRVVHGQGPSPCATAVCPCCSEADDSTHHNKTAPAVNSGVFKNQPNTRMKHYRTLKQKNKISAERRHFKEQLLKTINQVYPRDSPENSSHSPGNLPSRKKTGSLCVLNYQQNSGIECAPLDILNTFLNIILFYSFHSAFYIRRFKDYMKLKKT